MRSVQTPPVIAAASVGESSWPLRLSKTMARSPAHQGGGEVLPPLLAVRPVGGGGADHAAAGEQGGLREVGLTGPRLGGEDDVHRGRPVDVVADEREDQQPQGVGAAGLIRELEIPQDLG